MKWIFFLIVLAVLGYMAYSTRFAFVRQFASNVSQNDNVENVEPIKGSENSDSDVELESNILNTMERIKKQ